MLWMFRATFKEGGSPEEKPPSLLEEPVRIPVLLFAALSLEATLMAQEQERKIQRADLPAAVEKTVNIQSRGAKINGFSEEKENGHTYYEAEMTIDGHSKDVLIDKDGGVVEVEEQLAYESLPVAVQEGLQRKAGQGKIVKIESLTKHGKLVAYEAKVLTDGTKKEVQVGPDGKVLDHEE
jgi:hypothetical protein